jgi:hypothetical protein
MPNQLAQNSVRTYHLAPEGFTAARNRLLRQRIALFAGIILFLIVLACKEFGETWQRDSVASLLPTFLFVLIVLGALAVGLRKGNRRNQESWNSFELVVGEDFVIRKIKDFPELEIKRHEVTAIRESAVGLHVETNLKDRTIGIASALVDYDDAKERLSRWMPVQQLTQGWTTSIYWMWGLPVIFIVLFGGFYMTTRSWVIVATGVPLLAGLLWSVWYIRKSAQVSAHMKRLSLFTLLPLLAIAAKLILAIRHWR